MKTVRLSLLLILGLMQAACAFGNKHAYHQTIVPISAQSSNSVSVATHDQREYIVSGDKKPHFVGLQRGGYGNPFNVGTASGKALADDVTRSVVDSLSSSGFRASSVSVEPRESRQNVISKLKAGASNRLLVITLNEWKTDTYQNTALHFNVEALVFDSAGKQLARATTSGKDDLGGSFWNPPSHAKSAIPIAFKEKLGRLLNDPSILAALR